MTDQDHIDHLMDRWTESRELGRDTTAADLCPDYPHLKANVEQQIRAVRAVDALRLPRDFNATRTQDGTVTGFPHGKRAAPLTFSPPQRPDELGRLGNYRLLKRLGEGGMGAVYLAEHDGLKRLDALKVMRSEAAASPQSRDRFLREARTAASIKHDHVVTIYHVGEENGVPFIAMEYLQGESLDDRLKRNPPLTPAEVVRIGREVADGLAAAHAKGLIHRDIKPANIWLERKDEGGRMKDSDGRMKDEGRKDEGKTGGDSPSSFTLHPSSFRTKILDFGLAREQTTEVQITVAGVVVGSPCYMSPEQAAGGELDARSDLFSLGVVLYRMATGRLPFQGPNLLAIMRQIDTHTPPPPVEVNPTVPQPLSDLIVRLLQKQPEARFATAGDVAGTLRAIEQGHRVEISGATQEYVVSPPATPRSRRWWVVAAVALVVCVPLLLGVGALLVSGVFVLKGNPGGGPGDGTQPVASVSGDPVPAPKPPLKGWIDIKVWPGVTPDLETIPPERRVNSPASVPLRHGEYLRIEARLNRPAYVYVVWIDPEGLASPMYPWLDDDWDRRPETEQPRATLSLPDTPTGVMPLGKGPSGIESLLLLVRETPLPPDANLRELFSDLPKQRVADLKRAVWFENGEVVSNEPERRPWMDLDRAKPDLREAVQSTDPVLRTQALLRTKLKDLFPYSRTVCFGTKGG